MLSKFHFNLQSKVIKHVKSNSLTNKYTPSCFICHMRTAKIVVNMPIDTLTSNCPLFIDQGSSSYHIKMPLKLKVQILTGIAGNKLYNG